MWTVWVHSLSWSIRGEEIACVGGGRPCCHDSNVECSPEVHVFEVGPQLFWKIVELSRGGALIDKVCHWTVIWSLRAQATSCPFYAFWLQIQWDQIPHFLSPRLSHHDGLYPFKLQAKINLPSFLSGHSDEKSNWAVSASFISQCPQGRTWWGYIPAAPIGQFSDCEYSLAKSLPYSLFKQYKQNSNPISFSLVQLLSTFL